MLVQGKADVNKVTARGETRGFQGGEPQTRRRAAHVGAGQGRRDQMRQPVGLRFLSQPSRGVCSWCSVCCTFRKHPSLSFQGQLLTLNMLQHAARRGSPVLSRGGRVVAGAVRPRPRARHLQQPRPEWRAVQRAAKVARAREYQCGCAELSWSEHGTRG